MTTPSSPDPLQLANSDKENSGVGFAAAATTSSSSSVFAAPSNTTTTAATSNKPAHVSSQRTSNNHTNTSSTSVQPRAAAGGAAVATSARRGRGRGRGSVKASATASTMQASPRRSTRTRSRSRSMSTSNSVNGSNTIARPQLRGDSDDEVIDAGDDARSVASSSATATRTTTARDHHARRSSNNGNNNITDHDAEHEQDDQYPSAPRPQQQQRGRGTSFIQQSERPSQASLKDTSVNIATAFRQAAVGGNSQLGTNSATIQPAPQSSSTTTSAVYTSTSTSRQVVMPTAPSSSSIGFLSRAGNRDVSLPSTNDAQHSHYDPQNISNSPPASSSHTSTQNQAPTSASKKRKSRSSSTKARSSSNKDTSWKPTKEELLADGLSTDEYTSEGAITTDPEDLTKYVENPWGKKVYTVEYDGGGRRIGKRRTKKRVKGDADHNGQEEGNESDEKDEEEEILLDDEDIESNAADATASPATRKRNAAARRGRASARGRRASAAATSTRARNASVEGSIMSQDEDAQSQAPSQAESQSVTSYYLHEPAQSDAGDIAASSSQAGPSNRLQGNKPELQTAQQAGLVQTYPKAGSFQPYFAYSTTTVGANGSNGNNKVGYNGNSSLRARRDTTTSISTEGGASTSQVQNLNRSYASRASILDESGNRGPSSTASFDQRGSEYDYAEEEKMTNALLAAKERGSLAKGIPEGRNILPDLLFTKNYGQQAFNRWNQFQRNQKEREMSLVSAGGSDLSSEAPIPSYRSQQAGRFASNASGSQSQHLQNGNSQLASTSRLAPKRAPAPPPRASSAAPSETTTNTNLPPGNYDASSSIAGDHMEGVEEEESFAQKQARKSLGRRMGEIVRGLFIMAYWTIVGPIQWAKGKDAQTLWKTAAAILLAGLVIGSMYEQNPNQQAQPKGSIWDRLPFTSSSHHPSTSFSAPESLPSNFDEVIQRLVSLESSFRSLSDTSNKQYTTSAEHSSLLRDSNKRLAGLEADFESERRKNTKNYDSLQKAHTQESDKIDNTLKGIKNKLDNLNDVLKSQERERKSDSSDLSKLKNDFSKVNKDFEAYKGRLDMLVGKTDAALHRERTVKLVREAIEEILPSRIAVNVDSKTGQVTVDPRFWQYLRSHFSAGDGKAGSALSKGSVSWEDFVHSNSDKIRKMIDNEVDSQLMREVREGAILSRKSFGEALERELRTLSDKLSQSTSEQIARLSYEVDGKISKLQQQKVNEKQGSKHASPSSIKLSSGQNVNSIVSTLIDEALSKYSKDVLGKPDFALYTAGGRVIPSLTSPSYEIRPSTLSGSLLAKLTGSGIIRGKAPVTALHHDISTGQCWAINGPSGQLGILLSRRIYPLDITVEHASKDVALDVTSAPKNFEAWGIISDPHDLEERISSSSQEDHADEAISSLKEGENKIGNMIRLVKGAYDVEASNNIQTFEVDESVQRSRIPISAVVFKILDNHGNEHLSCLYRVRVGGELAENGR